ncbi:two-component system response regulator [Desulfothermus naphthae]
MKKQTTLIVDDSPVNIDILKGILGDEYNIKAATNGEVALKIARKLRPDLILLDIMMPGMDGYEVCSRLKANIETQNIPVIFITAKDEPMDETHGFEVGAVDYITKPISPPVVLARVKTHLALHNQKWELERLVKERTKELLETQLEIIRRLGRAAEYRDDETGMHVIRMSKYAYEIALEIGLDEQDAELILNVAPMHDVGKIGIPDAILLKPGKLTPEEWEIMKKHTVYGARIIGEHPSKILKAARTVALTHHEKWDGTGYPYGLSGEDIPLIGRICAVADVFDALTSKRPYKEAWDIERAVNLILAEKGKHFDPILVDAFEKVLPSIIKIKEQYPDSG